MVALKKKKINTKKAKKNCDSLLLLMPGRRGHMEGGGVWCEMARRGSGEGVGGICDRKNQSRKKKKEKHDVPSWMVLAR